MRPTSQADDDNDERGDVAAVDDPDLDLEEDDEEEHSPYYVDLRGQRVYVNTDGSPYQDHGGGGEAKASRLADSASESGLSGDDDDDDDDD